MGMNIDFHDGPSCHLSKRFILWKPKLEVFNSILLAMEIPPSMENVPFMEFKHKICLSCRLPPPPPPIMSHPFLDPMIVGELQHKHKLFCHLFLRWLQAARKPGVAETIMGKMFSKHICKNATTEYVFCALIDTSNVSTSCFYHPNFPFCALIDTSNVSTSCFYHPNFPFCALIDTSNVSTSCFYHPNFPFCALIDTSNVSTSCFYHPNFPFCALIDTSNVSTSCFYHPNFPILSVETSCGKSFF